ncbi:DNA replication helicase, partial [Trachipleistophora hominis]
VCQLSKYSTRTKHMLYNTLRYCTTHTNGTECFHLSYYALCSSIGLSYVQISKFCHLFLHPIMVYISYDNPSIKRSKIKSSGCKKTGEPSSNDLSSDISSELDISTFYSDLHHVHQFILTEKKDHVLQGDDTVVYLYGEWDHEMYAPGMCIRIIECRCCSTNATNIYENCLAQNKIAVCASLSKTKDDSAKKVFTITNTNKYLLLVETPTLSVTNLISGMECALQPLFNERIESLNFLYDDRRVILGKLFHVMLQRDITIDALLNEHSLELYTSNLTENEAKKRILDDLPKIINFRKKICGKNEEYIYSALLQMKGIIDIVDNGIIEIKTGNFNTKDVAQVLLYYLVSGIEPLFIYYLKNESFVNVKIKHFDIVSVLNRRNAVAFVYFMWNSMQYDKRAEMNREILVNKQKTLGSSPINQNTHAPTMIA